MTDYTGFGRDKLIELLEERDHDDAERAKRIVDLLVRDMRSRSGFDHVWDGLEESGLGTDDEIRETWRQLVLVAEKLR